MGSEVGIVFRMETTKSVVALRHSVFGLGAFLLCNWRQASGGRELTPTYLTLVAITAAFAGILAWRVESRRASPLDWFSSFLIYIGCFIVSIVAVVAAAFGFVFAFKRLS